MDGCNQMQRIAGAEKALGGKCLGYGFDAPEQTVSDWNGGDDPAGDVFEEEVTPDGGFRGGA